MTELVLKVLASYLLGSLIGSLIVGRLRGGVDIRTLGSGNAGGTNALRTQGKSFALWVMLIDIGKGIVATRVIAPLPLHGLGLAGAAAALGPVARVAAGGVRVRGDRRARLSAVARLPRRQRRGDARRRAARPRAAAAAARRAHVWLVDADAVRLRRACLDGRGRCRCRCSWSRAACSRRRRCSHSASPSRCS